jgi:hypothetical protein
MLFLNFNQKYTGEHCHISHDPPRVPHFSHNSSACPSEVHYLTMKIQLVPYNRNREMTIKEQVSGNIDEQDTSDY